MTMVPLESAQKGASNDIYFDFFLPQKTFFATKKLFFATKKFFPQKNFFSHKKAEWIIFWGKNVFYNGKKNGKKKVLWQKKVFCGNKKSKYISFDAPFCGDSNGTMVTFVCLF